MNVPVYGQAVMNRLNDGGYEAYFVGGCVRDSIMGAEVHDYDITTNATPDEIKELFSDYRTILTGEKHGTVTVVSEGYNIEVTTYRIDGEYKNGRSPESVSFTKNIRLDLERRDFTINAVCYNQYGIYDPFNGAEDIKNRIIRTVGDGDKRFGEDALRIMRALRFAATLGFDIEEKTKKSIHKNAKMLEKISGERIYSEFCKMIAGRYCEKVLLEYSDVIEVFAPCIGKCVGFDQKNKYHIYDVYTHIVKSVAFAPFDVKIRLAMFFHDVGKPECFTEDDKGGHFKGHPEISRDLAKEVFGRFKADKETESIVLSLIEQHQRDIIPKPKYVKRFLGKFSAEFLDMLLKVKKADTLAHSDLAMGNLETIDEIGRIKDEILEKGECFSLKELNINGRDIMKTGIAEGVEVGYKLNMLLEAVIDGKVENNREALIEYVKNGL